MSRLAFAGGCAFAALVVGLHGQAPAQADLQPNQPAQQDRINAWLEDLDTLAKCLEEKHKNAFFKLSRQQFDQAVSELKKSIPKFADHEVLVGFMKLAALLEDGHTGVYPTGDRYAFRQYPIGLIWLKEGMHIGAAAEAYKDLLGARLIAVGKTPVDDAIRRVSVLFAAENESARTNKASRWLTSAEALAALGLIENIDKGHFTVVDAGGKQRVVELAPLLVGAKVKIVNVNDGIAKELPVSRKAPRTRYGHEWLADGKALYCWYDSCADLPGRPVAAWCKEVLADIDAKPPERLILDIRRNGGGNSTLLQPLIKGIKDRQAINEKGRLFVLIGAGTYSSAMLNAIELRKGTKAVLIGSPTGGSPNEFGEVKVVTLPHSKWAVQYSTRYFKMTNDGATTVAPDVEVICPSADYFAGGDPILEAALKYQP